MYVISLVFFGFAVRKYKDNYIPAAVAMMLWFLLTAMLARPAALLVPYLGILQVVEKILFGVMAVLLLWLCVLRKKPLRIDWIPLVGTVCAAVIRVAAVGVWADFILQIVLCAVAVWHIYWMSRPRFLK